MTRAMMHSTQVSVTLALNVITQDDTRRQLVIVPIVALTPVVFAAWQLSVWLTSALVGWLALVDDIGQAAAIGCKVLAIGCNALAWGVGVSV